MFKDVAPNVRQIWDQHRATIMLFALISFYAALTIASHTNSSTNNDAGFANAYYWLDSVVKGKLGLLLAAISFVIGLIWGVAKQSFMIVVGAFVIALLIAFGLDGVTSVVNSSLIMFL